jgi:hypothetical protein
MGILRSSMNSGLVGYYRRFIKGFSKIGCPITALQKKGVKFTWTSECEEIFSRTEIPSNPSTCVEYCRP